MELKIYDTKQTVAEKFSMYVSKIASGDQKIHIALSGGSTPKIVFDHLAQNYSTQINWENICLYWGDERCVDPSDSESNYKMTVEHLLSKINIPEANIFRIKGENDPEAEAERYGEVLQKELPLVDGVPQFDLVILGMGDDGHTASVFPYNIELWDLAANCTVAVHPDSGQKRVSLTGKVINNAKEVAFLVTGADKADKVHEIIDEQESAKAYPANLVKPKSGNLVWFLDEDAAAKIE